MEKKSLAETHPELAKEWHPTKNGDLTPYDVTARNIKKAWWLLSYKDPVTGKHFDFEWEAIIRNRSVNKIGCPYLSGQAVWKGFNDLATTHPELAKEWHPTKNGKLTPNDVTAGCNKKVWWLLPYDDLITGKHFDLEWECIVSDRKRGEKCPYLSGYAIMKGFNDLATRYPELAKEWHPTKNGDLTPSNIIAGSEKKVWWLLPYDDPITGKHFNFEWKAQINSRMRGTGCPYLSGQAVWKGFNDLATTHPELAKEWHPTKNGNLTPYDVTARSGKKVWWLLPYDDPTTGKHFNFEWKTNVYVRASQKHGCPYLSGRFAWRGYNDLATTHPELAKEWHPTKNGNLTPYDITVGSGEKVWWLLPYDDPITGKHFDFEWESLIKNRVNGIGCPYLSGRFAWKGYNDLATTHPELAKEWHPTKNGNLTPYDVTAKSRKKVWWLLPYDDPITGKHFDFEWETLIYSRTSAKYSFPYLSGQAVWKGFNDLATTHPELAKEWHPTKNGKLTPYDVTAGSNKKVWWIGSSCNHEWESIISTRKQGCGCPVCVSSDSEKKTYIFFKSKLIKFKKEYSFPDCKHKNVLKFDYAVFNSDRTIVFLLELDGLQHDRENKNFFHKQTSYENSVTRDNIKTQYCKDNNIPLIRIPESEFKNLENILEKTLKEYSLI